MASKSENNPVEEEERKIPVLTVLKHKTILKNIFIVNKPPDEEEEKQHRDHEDILLVGRHPDCDLMLTHPSISRFHLQLRSKPSSLSVSVLDLSSVHGTWVSGRKIEAGVSVEMKESETLRIGVSSRVYRLHWIPISLAYDLENPFLQQRAQNLNSCHTDMEKLQLRDSILESISSLFFDEDVELAVKEKIPVAQQMVDDIVSLCCEEEEKGLSKDETFEFLNDPFRAETSYSQTSCDGVNKKCDSLNQVPSPPYVESDVECGNALTEILSKTECLPVVEAVFGTKMQQFQSPEDTFTSPIPPCMQNSHEKHCSTLLINMCHASLDEKNAAEALVPKKSDSGCKVRDSGRAADVSTAGARTFICDNMLYPLEEVIPSTNTNFQQSKVVEEVALDSSSDGEKQNTFDRRYSVNEIVQDIGNKSTAGSCPISLQLESVNSSMPWEDVLHTTKENQALNPDMEVLESNKAVEETSTIHRKIWSRRGKATSAPHIRSSQSILKSKSKSNVDNEDAMSNENNIINKAISKDLLSVLNGEEEEEEIFTPDKENFTPNALQLLLLKQKGKQEETKLSKSKRLLNSKDNYAPTICPDESICLALSKKNENDITNTTISKDLFSVFDGEEEEDAFTPDKENFSPNTLQLRLLKTKGKLEEIKHSKSQLSQNNGPNIYQDESISPASNKENQIQKRAQDRKLIKPFGSHVKLEQEKQHAMALKSGVERVPFQILKSCGSQGRSSTFCAVSSVKSINVSKFGQNMDINPLDINGVQKRSWYMVVDTTSLTNKESRKALQLLQGLKATRLIIPRLVIRELQSMKQQFTIFRKNSEASLALEWIEECLVKTNWWIHIQSSVEEGWPVAPTPPASPQTQLGEERCWTLQPLSCHKYSMEIISPTIEDHILDFALLYKRKQNDGQLVLLSEDVTLKIKCMAEGLLCETVQEFRESLVNPFSGRFLWTNSSPRGQTWSCQDDVVLRDKYCPLSLKKSSKGGAVSGLKLILLHNSQYGH